MHDTAAREAVACMRTVPTYRQVTFVGLPLCLHLPCFWQQQRQQAGRCSINICRIVCSLVVH